MSLKIEAGKFYRTREGQKLGPAKPDGDRWDLTAGGTHSYVHYADGTYSHLGARPGLDLVSEWVEGPVRTVTSKEIVPGTYGRITVERGTDDGRVTLSFVDRAWGGKPSLNADELRAAIATLTEIADALGEAS